MGSPRRKHSREFKLKAVKQVVQHDRSVWEVADGLGVNRNLLTRWKAQFEKEGAVAFPGHGRRAETEAEAEIRELKRKLAIACQERDIPKKTRPTSRTQRTEVRVRPRPPGVLRGGPDVQDPAGLPERFLRVARSQRERRARAQPCDGIAS
jgi:transposase